MGASISDSSEILSEIPLECSNPVLARAIFQYWLDDCKGQFVKPPTIEQCLSRYTPVKHEPLPMVTIGPEDEDQEWQLIWVPTHVEIESSTFRIVWAPLLKRPMRIALEESPTSEAQHIELQGPERTYTVTTASLRPDLHLTEVHDFPLCNTPALRLEADLSTEPAREKARKRIRDARLRAKLAKYRVERLEHRFMERFGIWPEEDHEEAQTEVDRSSDEEA